MSQGQEIRSLHPPLEGPSASLGAGSNGKHKENLLHKHIEQSLRDMAKSAQTVRDVLISAQPTEDGREQALIEYEERIAAIQALAQGVFDLQSRMNMPGHESALPTSDSDTLSLSRDQHDEAKQTTKREHGIEIASGTIADSNSSEKEKDEYTFPGLNTGGESAENPKLSRQLPPLPPPPPHHSTPTATTALPLHLIPLLTPKSSPSNKRLASIDLAATTTTTTIDEDENVLLPHGSGKMLPHAGTAGETASASPQSQSDLWHSQTRVDESPGTISRTLAYAMGRTQPVGSLHLPTPREGVVDSKENSETGARLQATESEKAGLSPVFMVQPGTGEQIDVAKKIHDPTQQQTNREGRYENSGIIAEGLQVGREAMSLHRFTFWDVDTGRVREVMGETKTVANAKDVSKNLGQEGAKIGQRESHEALAKDEADNPTITREGTTPIQPHPKGGHIKLIEQVMEIHREKQEVKILEETLQAREKDLCDRLETVRQGLQAIRQRKVFIDRQEDGLRKKVLEASRDTTSEESVESKFATMQVQRAGEGVEALEANAVLDSEEPSLCTVKSVQSHKERVNQSSILRDGLWMRPR